MKNWNVEKQEKILATTPLKNSRFLVAAQNDKPGRFNRGQPICVIKSSTEKDFSAAHMSKLSYISAGYWPVI